MMMENGVAPTVVSMRVLQNTQSLAQLSLKPPKTLSKPSKTLSKPSKTLSKPSKTLVNKPHYSVPVTPTITLTADSK